MQHLNWICTVLLTRLLPNEIHIEVYFTNWMHEQFVRNESFRRTLKQVAKLRVHCATHSKRRFGCMQHWKSWRNTFSSLFRLFNIASFHPVLDCWVAKKDSELWDSGSFYRMLNEKLWNYTAVALHTSYAIL